MFSFVKKILIALIILAALAASTVYFYGQRTLAQLDGTQTLEYLGAPVQVERDSLGIPIITAKNRMDAAYALGFIHGQERFFQMDLTRRAASGELAEVMGEKLIARDQAARVHRFRDHAQDIVNQLPMDEQQLLLTYAYGVNEGLAALQAKPFEYLVLGQEPAPWLPEDSLMVFFAMYVDLHDSMARYPLIKGYMEKLLPEDVVDFFAYNGSVWEATMDGSRLPIKPIPGAESFAYLAESQVAQKPPCCGHCKDNKQLEKQTNAASNIWAIGSEKSQGSRAILASDPHLNHSVPNIWFRMSLRYSDDSGKPVKVDGVGIPGIPLLVEGSNGSVAWGFTNTRLSTSDLIVLDVNPNNPDEYWTENGYKGFTHITNTIKVKDQEEPFEYETLMTEWGPVIKDTFFGKPLALRWVGHDLEAVNMRMLAFETATSTDDIIALSETVGLPSLNFMAADKYGVIGWIPIGIVPERNGHLTTGPITSQEAHKIWKQPLARSAHPRILSRGSLWNANDRPVGDALLERLGGGDFENSARAYQVSRILDGMHHGTEADLFELQFDDEAVFLGRWQQLLLKTLTDEAVAQDPAKAALREYVTDWGGRAAVESVGYRMVRDFHNYTARQVLTRLLAPCFAAYPEFTYQRFDYEEPLWMVVSQQPDYLMSSQYGSWEAELLAVVDQMFADYREAYGELDLSKLTWGARNTLAIKHPLSKALPFLSGWLDMPAEPVAGDTDVVRFCWPSYGPSMRMIVSPGHEEDAILHMPTGQSGNPFSKYYKKGHEAWVHGKPLPLLPGEVEHTLKLLPAES